MTKAERIELAKKKAEELKVLEADVRTKGFTMIAGVDEVGRGPLAGPVVAAACVFSKDVDIIGIDDSKKLSEKKRESLYEEILEKCLAYGIGQVSCEVIDRINILEATKLAMKEAVSKADEMLLRSGREKIDFVMFDAIEIKELDKAQMSIIKGDQKSLSIAAASIIAKVTRDRLMKKYAISYPGYDFESNKGYGTKAHYRGIKEYGITEIHRKSFLRNLDEH